MYNSDSAGFQRQCIDLEELHMVEIRFGNLVQQENEFSGIFEHPSWPSTPFDGYLFSW